MECPHGTAPNVQPDLEKCGHLRKVDPEYAKDPRRLRLQNHGTVTIITLAITRRARRTKRT